MYRIDNASSVAALPAYDPIGTADRYFDDGTVWDKDFANTLQEEMVNVAIMKGAALVKGTNTQMATALNGIQALASASVDTGQKTTTHRRALVASYLSRASGANSACVASTLSFASGDNSAVVAGNGTVTGNYSAAIACVSTAGAVTVTGNNSAVIASDGGIVDDDRSAIIASLTCRVRGERNAAIASDDGDIGTTKNNSAMIATRDADVDHSLCVAIASDDPGTSLGDYTLYGGFGGAVTWTIYSATGDANFEGELTTKDLKVAGSVVNFSSILSGAVQPGGTAAGELWVDTGDQTIKLGV